MSQDRHEQRFSQLRGAVVESERIRMAAQRRRGRQLKLWAVGLLPWPVPPYGYRLDPERPRDPAGVHVEPADTARGQALLSPDAEANTSLFGVAKRRQRLSVVSPSGHWRWNPATRRGVLTKPAYTGPEYTGRTRSQAPQIRCSATPPIGPPTATAQRFREKRGF